MQATKGLAVNSMNPRQRRIVAWLAQAWRDCDFDDVLDDAAVIFHAAVFVAKRKEGRPD